MTTHRAARQQPRKVHRLTRQAIAGVVRSALQGLRASEHQRLGDWAQEHFVLDGDSSHKRGRWQAWPFQVAILDWMGSDDIEELDVMKAKRVGYTKCLVASIAYDGAHRPRKQVVYQPVDEDRDDFVTSEVKPIFDIPAVASEVRKGGTDKIGMLQFRRSVARFLGGSSPRVYRRITVDAVKFDELDGFPLMVGKSSDPVTLGKGRLEGAPFPKLICGSTPRVKGFSNLQRRVDQAEARMRYRITCPHCHAEHPLIWGGRDVPHGMKWERGNHLSVRHLCPHCRGAITQADYLRIWNDGVWVCDITGRRYGPDRLWRDDRGQHCRAPAHVAVVGLWSAYSPQRSWPDIAKEHEAAVTAKRAGDSGPLQGFTNETLGELWEDDFEQTEAAVLQRRAQAEALPMRVIPRGAYLVLAAVDVQGDRWEYTARAIGRDGEAWTIDYRVIYGDTSSIADWRDKLGPLTTITYRHANGPRVRLSAMAVDTGYQTHNAYEFARLYKDEGVFAVNGEGKHGLAIKAGSKLVDISYKGRKLKKGVRLWHVGTDAAKDLLHGRLKLEGSGPGRQHFAADLPESFFKGLTAEQRIPVQTKNGIVQRWECPAGRANEPLDTTVYTMFLEDHLGIADWPDHRWAQLAEQLQPDLFTQAETDATGDGSPATDDGAATGDQAPTASGETTPDIDDDADEEPGADAHAIQPVPPRRHAPPSVATQPRPPAGIASGVWGSRI